MKNTYRISILNPQGQMVAYKILAINLSQAIAAAQKKAGVASTVDPNSTVNEGPIDIDATIGE